MAKVANETGLATVLCALTSGSATKVQRRTFDVRPDKHTATLGKMLGSNETEVWVSFARLEIVAKTSLQRIDAGLKYLLAAVFIDSRCSWSKGPRKLFRHLCLPVLSSIRLPDLKNLHPRQVLEQLMRQRSCKALEVRKSTPDGIPKVESKAQ